MTTIWQVIAGSPSWVRALVIPALALPIGGGSLAILSGFAAALAPKGGRLHRTAGKAFVAAMLVMTSVAVAIACAVPQRGRLGRPRRLPRPAIATA
jgi:hypothetical protein